MVDGPAAIKLLEGSVSVFGCRLKPRTTYVLRPWRRYPIYALQDSKIEINPGTDSKATVVESGDTTCEWKQVVEKIEDKRMLAVCGPIDSGKTSFTTLAANIFAEKHGQCVVVSLDPGQSYFTPPSVVGAAYLREPVHDLVMLKPFFQSPVGSTSAAACAEALAEAAEEIFKQIPKEFPVVVDVDGWVEGPLAVSHKTLVLKTLGCASAVILGENFNQLKNAFSQAGIQVEEVNVSAYVKQRDQLERRKTREWLYRKFLGKPTLKIIPSTWVILETACKKIDPLALLKESVEVLGKTSSEATASSEHATARKKTGLISYFYDSQNRYQGIGLFLGFNREKNGYKILSTVEKEIGKIVLGRIVLSEEGDEILQLN